MIFQGIYGMSAGVSGLAFLPGNNLCREPFNARADTPTKLF